MAPTHTSINRWRAFTLLAVPYFMTIVDFTIPVLIDEAEPARAGTH